MIEDLKMDMLMIVPMLKFKQVSPKKTLKESKFKLIKISLKDFKVGKHTDLSYIKFLML